MALDTDPIAQLTELNGNERATLVTAGGSTSDDYDPTSPDDFTPGVDQRVPLIGFDSKDHVTDQLPQGCVAAFTASCRKKPAGLTAQVSRLLWRDLEFVVHSFQQRTYASKINGYTLFLQE